MSSFQIRSPASPPTQPSAQDLKQRVITCLNRLADRDTLALAAAELDSIAVSLSPEYFCQFINCLHNIDSSTRSPVRKHCMTLLSLLSRSHGDSFTPHLSKMVSTVLRRLRDPDSAVRAACAAATADMCASITRPHFSVLSGPLIETLVQDRDANAQIGAAMCLAAAVEAAPKPEPERLRKTLPKMAKLLKSEGFKAKSALLGAIGSIIGAGGAASKGVLDWLVPCILEFLSSEDWAARKSATEALARVATGQKELAPQYRKVCLAGLESKRFDKVKIVRETMNQTLELWKEVPGDSGEVSTSPPQSDSFIDNGCKSCFTSARPNEAFPTVEGSSASNSSSVTNGQKKSLLKSYDGNLSTPLGSKLEDKELFDLKAPQLQTSSKNMEQDVWQSGETKNSRPKTRRALFSKTRHIKEHKFVCSRDRSRVAPFDDEETTEAERVCCSAEAADGKQRDAGDLFLMRRQIAQIEKQQSYLSDLLKRFIGSSQTGINSLESRVHGLEMALDDMSHDWAVSSGRIPSRNYTGDTCCKMPGAEFLSPKFWRKTDSRFSSPIQTQPTTVEYNTSNEHLKAELSRDVQVLDADRLHGASLSTCTASVN